MERRRRQASEEDGGPTANDLFHLDSDTDSDSSDIPMQVDRPDRAAPMTYYTHELSARGRLRLFFIRNSTTRVACTFFDLTLKIVICAVYVLRVILDDLDSYECGGSPCYSEKGENGTDTNRPDGVNWYPVLWVKRSLALWLVEVILAAVSLSKAGLMVYISTKGHRVQHLLSSTFILEIICTVPILVTLAYPPLLKDLFAPVFINCKLAQRSLQKIYNDLHLTRQKFQTITRTLLQQMIILMTNIICLAFVT
ncbi:hypothetical protein EGW08_003581 [Elysia chlorotica]|uniref:Ion transport domain-containing protein n=1 Tax=Elysia chlorotica TaxID=188477 RepID=A0A433U470_ELYCH|nr:hypothetical protein EGW08_003581 [Elysia chlorotica]